MNIIAKEIKLIKRYIIMSFKNYIQFPIDGAMNFIMIFFDIATLVLFWYSIMDLGIIVDNWNHEELFVFVAMTLLSEAISKTTFGFRDIEYTILDGTFDKYLIRPVGPIKSVLMEKLNIFAITSKVCISVSMMIFVNIVYNVEFYNIFWAFLILVIGTLTFELLYGSFSLLAFWVGRIYTIRNLVFSFRKAKNYPIDIFPDMLRGIFTYVVPLSFMSTIPTKILLRKEEYIFCLGVVLTLFIVFYFIFHKILKHALLQYQSTGS